MANFMEKALARRSAAELQGYLKQAEAAKGAPWGSLAQQYDPSRYGSQASTKYPGIFGQEAQRMQRRAAQPAQPSAVAKPAEPAPATFDSNLVGSAPAEAAAQAPPEVAPVLPGRPRRRGEGVQFEPLQVKPLDVLGS